MRVWIQIFYHGGFPRTHCVSVGFLERLRAVIRERDLDVEIIEM